MAKAKKKSAKEASNLFHNIMKASVAGRKFFKGTFDNNILQEIVPFTPEVPGETASATNYKFGSREREIEYVVVEAATELIAREKILKRQTSYLKQNKKATNMTHKQFQHDRSVDEGTDVQFNLDYDGNNISIVNIQIHSNYDSGLPHNPTIEVDPKDGNWKLRAYYPREINGIPTQVAEWIESTEAKEITDRILAIKEEEKPKFV